MGCFTFFFSSFDVPAPGFPLFATSFIYRLVPLFYEVCCDFDFFFPFEPGRQTFHMAKEHHSLAEQQKSFSDTIITSRNNLKIKQIRALLRRSERERTGLALVEGLRLVTEALRYPQRMRQLIVAPELLRGQHGWLLLQD